MSWFGFGRGKRHQVLGDEEDFLLITWDSCRHDAFVRARTPVLDQFGPARRAGAMATYTLPAHVAMFQGFLPHVHEREPFYNRYCQQLWRISHRNVHTKPLVTFPTRSGGVVCGFRSRGYLTAGVAAMEWFRDAPVLQDGFEHFTHTGTAARRQNELLTGLVERRARGQPCFLFVNYGETHNPFRYEGMPPGDPELEKRFSKHRLFNQSGVRRDVWMFDEPAFARQVACAEYLDARTGELIDLMRRRGRPTTVVVCGDHGECFGEHGMYGHGFYHEKVMEIPMLIFRLNAPPHGRPEASEEASRSAA